jgi:gliding motility-associated-like protein
VYELVSVEDGSNTACSQPKTGTVTVVVNPLPTATINGDTTLCRDAAQPEVTFTGANATGPYTFTYTINGGAPQTVTSTGDIATVLVPTNTAGTYTYELVSVQDASSTACEQVQTGTATVVVNPLPEATIAGDIEVCQDDTEPTITFTGSNSTAPYTFVYTINGGVPQTVTSVGNTATITAPTDAVGTFTYALVSVQDASATACEQTQTGTIAVVVNPLPNVSFDGQDLIGCSPICPEITSTSTVGLGSNIVDYTWDFSNGESSSSPSPTYTECLENYSGNPIYIGVTLTATTDKGCVSSHNEPNYIQVNHNPIADFTFSPENPDIINNKVDFSNASSYADLYDWNFGGIGFSTETNPSFSFPEEGNQEYIVELIASTTEGCTDTVIAIINVADRIIFYVPNTFTPDGDNYNETFKPVFTSGFDPMDFHLLIFNRWGEVVFESFDAKRGWNGTYGAANDRIVKDGTYVWKIEFKETMSDQRHVHTGHVNVIK